MPEHTSWFTYLMSLPGLQRLEWVLNDSVGCHEKLRATDADCTHSFPANTPATLEFTSTAIFVILLVVLLALLLRARIVRTETAILPEGKLTLSSFLENFVEIFYGMLRDALGPSDAKFFLPIIGTCAVFIFFSNALGLIPGFVPPTSNYNVTLACGLVIFFATHYYGLKRNGMAYLKHFVGPVLALAPLMIVLEIVSHLVRPLTLGLRLMVNMFVDHLVVGVFTALVALVLPVPIMIMGILVVAVQTYVFCLLATVYIKMAIEHEHEEGHGAHGHEPNHGHDHLGEAPIAA